MRRNAVKVVRMLAVAGLCALPVQALAVSFTIGTGDINDGAVTESKIATDAVTNDKIKTGTISRDKLGFTIDTPRFANIITVAKSGGDFTSPIEAVNSIVGASASGPYLVKVMPGVYDLGASSLVMKEYVYLEGSGDDSTIITSNSQNVNDETCDFGTVNMANNSSIKNIKIVNTNNQNDSGIIAVAIVFNNVKAKAEGVKALSGAAGVMGRIAGICSFGPSGHALLNNVDSEGRGSDNTSAVFLYNGGSVTINNSRLVSNVSGENASGHGVNCTSNNDLYSGIATVSNSSIESIATQGSSDHGVDPTHCKTTISSSRIKVTKLALDPPSIFELNVFDSQIYVADGGVVIDGAPSGTGLLKIANSLLTNWTPNPATNIKLFNNYTQDLAPIANQ